MKRPIGGRSICVAADAVVRANQGSASSLANSVACPTDRSLELDTRIDIENYMLRTERKVDNVHFE